MLALLGACAAVAYHVVWALAQFLTPVAGRLSPVLAIVACTAAVRLALLPLSYYTMRGQARQARLQSKIIELRRRYAGQPDRLNRELTQLYRQEGTGMLASCLPALVQLPFFSVLYRLLESPTIDGRPNGLLSHDLLGAPLGAHWLGGPGPVSGQGAVAGCWAGKPRSQAQLARRGETGPAGAMYLALSVRHDKTVTHRAPAPRRGRPRDGTLVASCHWRSSCTSRPSRTSRAPTRRSLS